MNKIPVIIMSGDSVSIEHKRRGYELGADDYLVKPFDYHELLFKIDAVSRRAYEQKNNSKYIKAGCLCINLHEKIIYINNELIECSKSEYDFLFCLSRRFERVVSSGDIINYIWNDYEENNNRINTLKKLVSRLRNKIEKYGGVTISSVYGQGYKISGGGRLNYFQSIAYI